MWSIVAAAVLASIGPQAQAQHVERKQANSKAVTPLTANQEAANAPHDDAKGCPGTQYPRVNCNAISAQADLEQARLAQLQAGQAARQSDLFRTEILISFVTMLAAALAAVFAARAAGAARRTVEAFTDVEQATLYVELGNFRFTNVTVDFDIVANNLGRSAALVLFAGCHWLDSNKITDFKGGLNNIGSQIVPAAGNVVLKTVKTTPSALKEKPYLWLLMSTQAPLQGEIVHRMCFQPAPGPNAFLGLRYIGEYSDEIKKKAPAQRRRLLSWWSTPRGEK